MKKVEVRQTQHDKGSGLFAMEDIEKDEYVIEYVGKQKRENNYVMKINGMNLWINGNKKWCTGTIHKSLVRSKL
jgi:SET domain-containing protein